MKQLIREEIEKQTLSNPNNLLRFVQKNKKSIIKAIGSNIIDIDELEVDYLGNVSGVSISTSSYYDEDDTLQSMRVEGGISLQIPEKVDDNFVGEENLPPEKIVVDRVEIMFIEFNI